MFQNKYHVSVSWIVILSLHLFSYPRNIKQHFLYFIGITDKIFISLLIKYPAAD